MVWQYSGVSSTLCHSTIIQLAECNVKQLQNVATKDCF